MSYILQDIKHIYKCLDECLQNNTKSWFVRDISTTQKNQIISQINSLQNSALLALIKIVAKIKFDKWFYGVVVSTFDFESNDLCLIPDR